MNTDSLSRRLRFAPPQAVEGKIALTEADIAVFAAINRHGPLPSTYLHALSGAKNKAHFQWKLTRFYNGAANTQPLLSRPPQQYQSFAARYQHLVYDLTKTSRALLEDRGIAILDRTDPFLHRFMGACVGASIELAATEQGIRYIPRAEVLAKQGSELAIKVGAKTLIPDDLFGLQYPDKSYRFFAVEIDRNTESIERKKEGYNTFDKKLEAYLSLMSGRAFRDHWGIPNLLVLTITTNPVHLKNLVAHLDRLTDSPFKERFLFKAKPDFGVNWRVPPLMPDLLTERWARTKVSFNIGHP